jgi:hypothetical protein
LELGGNEVGDWIGNSTRNEEKISSGMKIIWLP